MRGPAHSIALTVACAVLAAAQAPARPNVLLITIDALRADRVTPTLMPTVAALAARGVRFERAYAHAPLTLPAHASILTGRFPPGHGVRNNGFRLNDQAITLAESLQQSGYRTAAFVGLSALDARFGLAQGFDRYDDQLDLPDRAPAGEVFRRASRLSDRVLTSAGSWIGEQRGPWFAWCHLRHAHSAGAGAYDASVTAIDAALAAFLTQPTIRSVLDRTLIVITADHGEGLGEHGEDAHGLFTYDTTLRVPLIVGGPAIAPREVRGLASHADIMPTILDVAQVQGSATDGQSLVKLMSGDEPRERTLYFEALDAALMRGWAPLTGVVTTRWKFIDLPLPELYDLGSDPVEQRNRAGDEPVVAAQLRDATVYLRTRSAIDLTDVEPEARARLRSLGYLGSASWRLGASRPDDDPKRLLPLHAAYEAAVAAAPGRPAAALSEFRKIIEQRPDFAAAIDAAAALLLAQGKVADAIKMLNGARAGGLRHRALAERLGSALLLAKDPRGAAAVLAPVVDADAGAVDARFLLARAYQALNSRDDAVKQLEAALRLDPSFPAASSLLERLRVRQP